MKNEVLLQAALKAAIECWEHRYFCDSCCEVAVTCAEGFRLLENMVHAAKCCGEKVEAVRHLDAVLFDREDAKVPLCGADPKGALLVGKPEDVTCLACVKQHASSLRRSQ